MSGLGRRSPATGFVDQIASSGLTARGLTSCSKTTKARLGGVDAFLKSRKANPTPHFSRSDQTTMPTPSAPTMIATDVLGMTTAATTVAIALANSDHLDGPAFHGHDVIAADHGRARVRLAAPTPLDIARNLAGWGAMVEVVEPRSVQAELARIGAELAGRYTGGP